MSKTPDASGAPPAKLCELLWLDPKRTARVRRQPPWRQILDDALATPEAEPGDPVLANQDASAEDRRDLLAILARADATDADGVAVALAESVRDDGRFAPPLVLVAGELRFPFDEIEALKATVITATPFAAGDEALKASVDAAKELLALPDLSPAPGVVEVLTTRIRDAFWKVKRAVPAGYLEAQADRALLEQRRYQRRAFAGAPHLRALLHPSGDRPALLVYLPEAVTEHLPLYQRFGARLVAEGHLSVDQYETHPFALEVLALAREREVPAAAGRRRG
jgi:hypothetical protein